MSEATPTPPPPAIPDNIDEIAERTEFKNRLAALNKGKVPSKADRNRLRDLALKLANRPGRDFDYIEAAVQAGAFTAVKAPKAKCTRTERNVRVETFRQWIRWGWSRAKMIQVASVKWGVGVRQVDNYLNLAAKAQALWLEKNRGRMEANLLGKLDEAYELARAAGQPATMISAADTAAKLLGLHKPVAQRFEFTGADGAPLAMLDVPEKKEPDAG